jgi:hypothetical protein
MTGEDRAIKRIAPILLARPRRLEIPQANRAPLRAHE